MKRHIFYWRKYFERQTVPEILNLRDSVRETALDHVDSTLRVGLVRNLPAKMEIWKNETLFGCSNLWTPIDKIYKLLSNIYQSLS